MSPLDSKTRNLLQALRSLTAERRISAAPAVRRAPLPPDTPVADPNAPSMVWEGFTKAQIEQLQTLWAKTDFPAAFGSHFVATVTKRTGSTPGMLSIEAKDLDLFRGHFSVMIPEDSDLERLVELVKTAIGRFWNSFATSNQLRVARLNRDRESSLWSHSYSGASPDGSSAETLSLSAAVDSANRKRAVEEVLLAEYAAAEADFDRAKRAGRVDDDAKIVCQRYIEATSKLHKFLERGEIPPAIVQSLRFKGNPSGTRHQISALRDSRPNLAASMRSAG